MIKNMGSADKIIRLVIALIVAVLYLTNVIDGTTAIVFGIIAIVMVATSFMSFCPLYLPFGISTLKKKK
jgi:hypothetical protein